MCQEALAHCLQKGGRDAASDPPGMPVDGAEMCGTRAAFLSPRWQLHGPTCEAFAEVGEHCAESCEPMADDALMRECAEACRRGAVKCREMAGVTA